MDFHFLVDWSRGGSVDSERKRSYSVARRWRYPVVAVMSITALGCGDDEAGRGNDGRRNATETSPDAGPLPTSNTDGSLDQTSRETNPEPAPTLPTPTTETTGEPGETSTAGTGSSESTSDTGDADSTSPVPVGDGRLNGLGASGELTPAFDVDVHEYDVTLPVFSTRLVLTAELEPGGSLDVDGAPFDAAGHWTSAPLDVGTTQFTMTWERADGVVQTYIVNAHRAEVTREYVGVPYSAPGTHGGATAISRDGNTLAVGSHWRSSDAEGPRVYVRSGEEWTLDAHLEHPNPPENGEGGWAIALSADGNTLIAGARMASVAYVFERTANGWEIAAELTGKNDDDTVADSLGDSVAISDDGDTVAVGSNRRNVPDGAVYVFQRNAGKWEQRARLAPAHVDAAESGVFCDPYNTELALDASGKTPAIGNGPLLYGCPGSVDVYENTGADWTKTSVMEKVGRFGADVDLNADGQVLVVAGDESWTVYTKAPQGWAEQHYDTRPAYAVHVTDSGDMVVTDKEVFLRTANAWTFETSLPEPKAVRSLSSGFAMSGDGSTVALGAHVYSTRPALWTALSEQPAGNTNCEARTHDVEGACLYELACDAERVEATCDIREDGTWQCGCYGAGQGELREYTVTGGDESSVCRLTATLCVEGNDLVSETECSREITPGAIDCNEEETCATTIDLDEGVQAAFEVINRTLGCWTDQKGDVYCDCGSGDPYGSPEETYAIFGVEASEACPLFKGICEGSVTVGQEQYCAEARIDVSDDYDRCTSKRPCGVRTPLDEGGAVYALSSLFESEVSCDNFRAGDECTCGPFNTYGAGLLIVDSTRPETSCRVADAVCLGASGVEASLAFECAVTDAELEDERCWTTADCGLAVEFEGTSASVTESVEVECTRGADDSWACDCTRGWDDNYQFSVDAVAAGGACDTAAVECAGRGTPLDSTPVGP